MSELTGMPGPMGAAAPAGLSGSAGASAPAGVPTPAGLSAAPSERDPTGSATPRYLRACRRLPVDTTPVWFMRQAGRALPEYRAIRRRVSLEAAIADPALAAEITLLPVTRLGVDAAIVFADITTPLPGLGIGVRLVDGVGPVVEAPVRSAADLDRLAPAIDPGAFEPTAAAIRLVRDSSPVPVIGFAGAPMRLLSLHGGMERLVEELTRGLEGRAEWHLGRGAEEVVRGPEGWRVVLEDGSSLEAAGLVLACPAPAGGRLLERVDGELARLLGTIAYGSLAVVNLAYREADLGRAPEGHGFLVPRAEPGRLRGVSWASRKWPGRAPPGVVLARAFLDLEPGLEPASEAIAEEAVAGLEPILAPRRLPFVVEVHRFARSMPRYTVGHLGRVAAIEARRRRLPGLFLVGSAYRGAGIGELVAAAETVAREAGAALGAGIRAAT